MEDFERPYKNVSRVKAIFLFLFRPTAFLEMATKHDIAWMISVSDSKQAQYRAGEYKPDEEGTKSNANKRTQGLRKSLLDAGWIVAGSVVCSLLSGYALRIGFGPLSNVISSLLQGAGAGVILWATLWQLTRNLQSFGGDSLPERVHSWIFRACSEFCVS